LKRPADVIEERWKKTRVISARELIEFLKEQER